LEDCTTLDTGTVEFVRWTLSSGSGNNTVTTWVTPTPSVVDYHTQGRWVEALDKRTLGTCPHLMLVEP